MAKDYITKTPGARVGGKNEGGKFINLLVDGNFKLVFSNPEHTPELIGILNEFIPDVTITELTLTQQEQQGRRPEQKSSVFDMECVVDGGRKIVVEVQFNSRPDYLNRMLYYSTWPISNQHLKGDNNYSLNDVYIISFCNFALLHDGDWEEDRVVSSYSIREDHNFEVMTTALHFIYVELGRFAKSEEQASGRKEHLLFRFKNFGHLDTAPKPTGDAIVDKLSDIVAIESLSEEDRANYDRNMRNEFDIRTEKLMIREAAFSEGKAEGIAEGEARGKAKGKAEGKAEGKVETRLEVARKMLDKGMNIQDICDITGLTPGEVTT